MRIFFLALLISLLIPLNLPAEELKGVVTLGRCLDVAIQNHPGIISARQTVEAAKGKLGQTAAGYYPQVGLSAGYNRIKSVATTAPDSYDQYSWNLSLTQTLYDFGKTSTQVDLQKITVDSAKQDGENIREQLIFNVKSAYYGVLKAIKNRVVAEETVGQLGKHLEQAKGFYEAGTKPRFDVTKAEVDLSNAKLNLIKADNALRLAYVSLNNAVGTPNASGYSVQDNLAVEKIEFTLDEALEKAYANRPDLKSAAMKKLYYERYINLAYKEYFPVLSAGASYGRSGADFPLSEAWNAGVSLTFPLFSGYSTKYQVAEAKANLEVMKANEEAMKQNIMFEVQQSYLSLNEARERTATSDLAVKQAIENHDIAVGRYAAGVGNPIEVTDAEVLLSNAKTSYIQALYDYMVAVAGLEKAMGIK